MENSAIQQPVRPPLSQQVPPQRSDIDNRSNEQMLKAQQQPTKISSSPTTNLTKTENERSTSSNETSTKRSNPPPPNQSSLIPDVDVRKAYKRRSLKHLIHSNHQVSINGSSEINELCTILGNKKCSMYFGDINKIITSCVVCDEKCLNGIFALETVLFIPNKNDTTYDNLGRFRIELPRISCHECAAEYAQIHNINTKNIKTNNISLTLGEKWKLYENGDLIKNKNKNMMMAATTTTSITASTPGSSKPTASAATNNDDEKNYAAPTTNQTITTMVSNENQRIVPVSEADRDPFDDGFLICTQLVKTGGADQGGLQVGDVFVEFGHYSKKRFPGLKSIANLVRRSAGKEINVVVWRKLEQMNNVDDDGSGRTVFQKLALKLKPLQSHDADGGGVLGAVINTYPLPEMKN